MIWLIATVVIALIAGALNRDKWVALPIFVVGMFASLFINMGAGAIFYNNSTCYATPLEALADNVGYHQNAAFLGSGSANDRPVFYYYANNDGVITLQSIDADFVTIRFSDESPRLLHCPAKPDSRWIALLSPQDSKNTFYIPQGSIVNSFKLDAQ